ncbi:MAG TPA: hypothetical protein PKA21_09510 [Kiritimatiellia bacterium]|nr:hypothetical protein [Kiritimatiellia bacterium]HMP95763.1 hypothetical protein [Kiritimatiellia bacterium]
MPPYRIRGSEENARKRLAAWLTERRIDQRLHETTDPHQPPPASALRYERSAPVREACVPGAVMILRPASDVSAAWGPVYVLIINHPHDGRVNGIPFSRYATPAVPGEWATGLALNPLRVLCLWNQRSMPISALLPGRAKTLPPKRMAELTRLIQGGFAGHEPTATTHRRLGPPLIHPADPRYDYLIEERKRLDDHLADHEKAAQNPGRPPGLIMLEGGGERAEWLLAAEGRPRYGSDHPPGA